MIIEKIFNPIARKRILWVLGILIVALISISIAQTFNIEHQRESEWIFYTSDNSDLVDDHATAVVIDKTGRAWIGSSSGVSVYNEVSWQNYPLPGYIRGMAVDPRGRIWVVLTEEIYIFEGGSLSTPEKVVFGTATRWESKPIAFDSSGNAWIGTGNGVEIFHPTSKTTLDVSNSELASNDITAIAFDKFGRAWIGTNKGISVYDGETWQSYNTNNSNIPGNDIKVIVFDHLGNAWIGTHEHGVGVFDGKNWETYYQELSTSGYVHSVEGIAFYSDGHVLVLQRFLTIFNGIDWITYDVRNSGLANASSNDIAIDPNGRLWITSSSGVNVAALDEQGLPQKVSDEKLADYGESIFNWRFFILPIIFLGLLWLAVFLDDLVILLLDLVIGVILILRSSNVLTIDELNLILIVPIFIGAVVGGVIGSVIRIIKNKTQKFNVKPTILGTIIGSVIGFIAGAFLWVLALSLINP